MNTSAQLSSSPSAFRRHPVLFAGAVIVLLLLAWLWLRPSRAKGPATAYHEVKCGDLTVSVVEGGTLAAVSECSIRSEVEGTARIIWIVPEGSYVKKGDLLVELDSSQAQDQVNLQEINYAKAQFAVEQARAQLEIQRSATNSDYLAADLKLRFAKIDRDKYERGQRLVDLIEASNKVVQAESQFAVNLDTYINSTNLAAKGYETKQRVDGDRLALLNMGNSLIMATNGVWLLQEFDVRKLSEKYAADIMQAEQELERVVSQNKRKMAQYEADLETQVNTLELSRQKLERDKKNLAGTKIYAPQDGLVVYAVSDSHFSSESLIEGGAVVRNRQELIKLPDLSRMKVTVKVHESHVNTIRPGLPAYVMLDSTPDQRFMGVVERVAPLPDTQSRWGNPNLKVYNTDVHIIDPLPNVKPGVSAKAEIIVTNIPNALSVPIQAITTFKGKPAVYKVSGGKAEPQPVEVGMFNIKFIEIVQGLATGDRVLLSPPFNVQEKTLDGAVLTPEERAKLAANGAKKGGAPATRNGATAPGLAGPVAGPGAPAASGDVSGSDRNRGPGRNGQNREELIKQFDKDGDGKLNEEESAAMRAAMGERRRGPDLQNGEPRRGPRDGAPDRDNRRPNEESSASTGDGRRS